MTTPDAFRDAEHFADVSGIPDVADYDEGGDEQSLTPAQQDLRQKVQRKTKIAFIDRLLRELDIIIYCELAALYYMEYVGACFLTRYQSGLNTDWSLVVPFSCLHYASLYSLYFSPPKPRLSNPRGASHILVRFLGVICSAHSYIWLLSIRAPARKHEAISMAASLLILWDRKLPYRESGSLLLTF